MDKNEIYWQEVIERFLEGKMSTEEKMHFEHLRNENQEFDALVVEQSLLYQSLKSYAQTSAFKNSLANLGLEFEFENKKEKATQNHKGKLISFWKKYSKEIGVAAAIASIVSLGVVSAINSLKDNNSGLTQLAGAAYNKSNETKKEVEKLKTQVTYIKSSIENGSFGGFEKPTFEGNANGSGFLINENGYLVTDYHVINEAKGMVAENKDGIQYDIEQVFADKENDISILKITDAGFAKPAKLPYSIGLSSINMAEEVFTIGFPRSEIVYEKGYISATKGLNGNNNIFQLNINANAGNSGSPVFDNKGQVIGIIKEMGLNPQNIFAIKTNIIASAIESIKKMEEHKTIKLSKNNNISSLGRTQQVSKISDYIFNIKVKK